MNFGIGLRDVSIDKQDSPSNDAFGRFRVSTPLTLFDTKLIHGAESLFWDDQEVSGSGTSSSHSVNTAALTLSVSASTAGKRVRQTYARPNYQPGKSQCIFLTGNIGGTESGITREIGHFDDDNGLFFRNDDGTLYVVQRGSMSGSAVDTAVAQSSWNVDTLDGSGPSGKTVDWTKVQIFSIDFEWLGVGRTRFALVIDGVSCPVHYFNNANNLTSVYMSTPNNPIRYSIENDGTGAASSMAQICSTVISEGGQQPIGVDHWFSTNGTHVDADAANTIYAVVGIRLKTANKGEPVRFRQISMLTETNDDFEWIIFSNPTVAGTFTYSDEANSPFQVARGATANTVSGGIAIAGGFGHAGAVASSDIEYEGGFGEAIDGTRDEFVLCVRPLSANADIQGGIMINVAH